MGSVADPDPFDTDPDPAFHFDTDPDPNPAFQSGTDPAVWYGPDSYLFKEVPGTVKSQIPDTFRTLKQILGVT